MGCDLAAQGQRRGMADYYRAGIEHMAFLRAAMLAAGVQEGLVYKKFVSNDGLFVTSREAIMIAQKLTAWLQGHNLTLDLAETNSRAHASLDALSSILGALGNGKEAARLGQRRRAKSLPIRVDRNVRTAIRNFAKFCAGSGGFYVR